MTVLPSDVRPFPFAREGFRLSSRLAGGLLPLVGILLACCQWFLPQQAITIDLVCIILVGLPHGALDVEIARHRLVQRMPGWWFPAFAIPYLLLAFVILALWRMSPDSALCLFLAMSLWHFGETVGAPVWQRLLRGGAPLAFPVLMHPTLTASLLGGIAIMPMAACPDWLEAASVAWLGLACGALVFRQIPMWLLRELALSGILYAIFPPLTALTIYFVCLHAPAHMHDVIDRKASARVRDMGSAWRHATIPTLLTIVIGSVLWRFYDGSPTDRLLSLTIQGLAALTLPHMMMGPVMARLPRDKG